MLDESELPRKFHSESDSPREAARIRFELARVREPPGGVRGVEGDSACRRLHCSGVTRCWGEGPSVGGGVRPGQTLQSCYLVAMTQDYWEDRHEHQQYVHDLAFQAHHYTRERAANIYANSRRVAGLMSAFEDDDYRLQVRRGHVRPGHARQRPWE